MVNFRIDLIDLCSDFSFYLSVFGSETVSYVFTTLFLSLKTFAEFFPEQYFSSNNINHS